MTLDEAKKRFSILGWGASTGSWMVWDDMVSKWVGNFSFEYFPSRESIWDLLKGLG